MLHRHLLPDEVDLLLDGDVGFGVAPLKAHVDACPECAARVSGARVVCDLLEDLPHFPPAPRFAEDVMARVQVIEPWHVAVIESARRLVPRSTPMRALMGTSALAVATTISASAVWLAFRADMALYFVGIVTGRVRSAMVSGAAAFVGEAFGQGALEAIRNGGQTGVVLAAGFLLAAGGGATLGFRALAAASRNRR